VGTSVLEEQTISPISFSGLYLRLPPPSFLTGFGKRIMEQKHVQSHAISCIHKLRICHALWCRPDVPV